MDVNHLPTSPQVSSIRKTLQNFTITALHAKGVAAEGLKKTGYFKILV